MPVIARGENGKLKYGYRDERGLLYWLDRPKEEPIYSGKSLIVRMDKLREVARKYRFERYKGTPPDDDPPVA